MNARSFGYTIVVLSTLLAVSCGIPTIPFLGAPDSTLVGVQPTPPTVTFEHNSADNSTENFLGYEVYYKFYRYTADPQSGDFGADRSAIDNAPAGSGITVVESRGYRRMFEPWQPDQGIWNTGEVPTDLTSAPLLSVDELEAATDFTVQLSFPDRPSALLIDHPAKHSKADYLGRTVYLIRNPRAWQILTQRSFDSDSIRTDPGDPTSSDPDIQMTIPDTDSVIHLGLVLLAYGIDFAGGTFVTLYSDPITIFEPLEIILQ